MTLHLQPVFSACFAALAAGLGLLLFDGLVGAPTERGQRSWEATASIKSRPPAVLGAPFYGSDRPLAKVSSSTRPPPTGPPFTFEGHVYGKSDVEGRRNRPVEVLLLAVRQSQMAQLAEAAAGGDRSKHNLPSGQNGEIWGVVGSVSEPFSRFAVGHDVTSADGRYRINVEDPGLYYLCLTGETSMPKSTPWTIAGCMGARMPPPGPKSEPRSSDAGQPRHTKEQDLYMQFGRLVRGD
jgi:hypothetical protein